VRADDSEHQFRLHSAAFEEGLVIPGGMVVNATAGSERQFSPDDYSEM
jgi:hypothetical protein